MKKKYSSAELRQFWVGLLEGDGSIQVNHWRSKLIQYRLVINLKYTEANMEMLKILANEIGGTARKSGEDAVWVVNDKEQIKEIIKIFDTYPLLTTRAYYQLEFLKACLAGVTIQWYMEHRGQKYANQASMVQKKNQKEFTEPSYFNEWLSGFTEAEGSFSMTEGAGLRYSIGQNNDKFILEAIKKKFETPAQVGELKTGFFHLNIGGKSSLKLVIDHFEKYPLLGEKAIKFAVFREMFREKWGIWEKCKYS